MRLRACPVARTWTTRIFTFVALPLFVLLAGTGASWGAAGDTYLVNVGPKGGALGAHHSNPPAVSANGRYVLYGHDPEVVLRDRWSRTNEIINTPYTGGKAAGGYNEGLSADGRFVTFCSYSPDVVAGDSNGVADVFLRDRQTGVTERISVTSNETEANGDSYGSVVSDDGRYVAFISHATNLAPAASAPPIYVRDRQLGTTRRLVTGAPWALAEAWPGQCGSSRSRLAMSASGRYVAFDATGPGALSEVNVFVQDRGTGTTRRVSTPASGNVLASSGGAEEPAISANGRYVAFASVGSDFGPADADIESDVYVRDLQSGAITRESHGIAPWVRGQAYSPSLSRDGRFVSFGSLSFNLVAGQPDRNGRLDIYTRDRQTGAIERNSIAYDGGDADSYSQDPVITRSGRYVVFLSLANNLVQGYSNGIRDVFLYDRGPTR
jgi:Tol biopolymer transport system component